MLDFYSNRPVSLLLFDWLRPCFVQFWVCVQLPLVGQPESQLGGGKESGHDGATAGGPQICYSPGRPQGESTVSFAQIATCKRKVSHYLPSSLTWGRRSRGRTWSACRTPQPQRWCMLMGWSGWSQRCCSPGPAKVQAHPTNLVHSVCRGGHINV